MGSKPTNGEHSEAEEHSEAGSETFLTSLIDLHPLAIVVLDSRGRIRLCNRAFETLFLYEQDEILGRDLDALITAPAHQEEARELTRQALAGNNVHVTTRRVKKGGQHVDVEFHGVPLGEEVEGAFGLYQDITEKLRLERAQEEEIRQSQKMEAIGRLAGGIAHDFNNLLTIILGHCSLLERKMPESSEYLGSMGEIRRAAEQAGLMTRRLLTFGRKQSIMPQVLDLNRVITSMERMLRRLVRADIDLVINANPSIGRVRCDPGQLEQVILNLVINAGDAMPGGGMLTLETFSLDLDDTLPHEGLADVSPPWTLLTVSDTGIGMDHTTLERLFEPFFTTKKKGKGTGLGLSTVYGIVKQNGGNILVDSRPGHGTTFRIFFPQVHGADAAAEKQKRETLAREMSQGSETVLVVEDEPGVRQLAIDFLTLHGYNVLDAEDGLKGLEMVRHSGDQIQLILSDVVMPGMNGPDMVEHVALSHPGIKVVFMSGYDNGVLNRGDAMARYRLVAKPFSMQVLVGAVRSVLDGRDLDDSV